MATFKVALVALDSQEVPDWVRDRLAREGIDFVSKECTTQEELSRHAGDADVVWMLGTPHVVTAETLPALSCCRAILRTGSGTDDVPVEEATRLGIVVANTPEAFAEAVSDHAIGLLFAIIRQIAVQDRMVRMGTWNRSVAWPLWQVSGRTLGLVGFGRIAQSLARKLSGFQMTILAYDPYLPAEAMAVQGVRAVTLDELLTASDIVSLHCPLTAGTFHLIDEQKLGLMKSGAVIINTARGKIVDEPALLRALTQRSIGGAGLDVLESEPPDTENPFIRLDNVVITPHIAAYSEGYLETCWRLSIETIVRLRHGRWPASYVNRGVRPRVNLT